MTRLRRPRRTVLLGLVVLLPLVGEAQSQPHEAAGVADAMIKAHKGRRSPPMTLGVLLMAYVAALYLLGMWWLWRSLQGQQTAATAGTEGRFALKEGQTIVGVRETTEGIDFYMGDAVVDENSYDC